MMTSQSTLKLEGGAAIFGWLNAPPVLKQSRLTIQKILEDTMKTKINLLSLSKNELKNSKSDLAPICGCGCLYAGPQEGRDDDYYGSSSTEAIGFANNDNGLWAKL